MDGRAAKSVPKKIKFKKNNSTANGVPIWNCTDVRKPPENSWHGKCCAFFFLKSVDTVCRYRYLHDMESIIVIAVVFGLVYGALR